MSGTDCFFFCNSLDLFKLSEIIMVKSRSYLSVCRVSSTYCVPVIYCSVGFSLISYVRSDDRFGVILELRPADVFKA